MDKSRKANWTREEECSLINEIESPGEILRGSGNSADKNRQPERLVIPVASTVSTAGPVEFEGTPILESPEVEISTTHTRNTSKKGRKRRRIVDERDDSVNFLKAADLLPLQQEVLFQQMAVFSAQLQLIEEQRDYYTTGVQ